MKEINQALIFNAIREKGPLSRSQLAKDLRLSPTTVTVIVDQFIANGFVVEVGKGDSNGGRKPILVELAKDAGMVVAIDLEQSRAALMNMKADLLITKPIPPVRQGELITILLDVIREMVGSIQGPRLLGIGIAVPGIIDPNKSKVITATSLNINHLSLKEELEKHFQVPIWLENDANAAAYGEFLYGRSQNVHNFLYLHVGRAVGAGLFLSGNLFTGGAGGAGEFGHITVDPSGPPCHCGNIGCLGKLIGAAALLDQWCSWTGSKEAPTLVELVKLSNEGDSTAIRLMDYAGEMLGRGIVTLIHLFNPSLILMGGELALNNTRLFCQVKQVVKLRSMPVFAEHVQIEECRTRLNAGIVGAGSLALNHFFRNVNFEAGDKTGRVYHV
ncbi:ROK family transcriptional regulator [Paenibacillus sp. GD4]|uniref:ROK family transcriptional regulator n=1 Tax=Paenibacillus sp. GD4 TaxID=3068890 RepID=UPI00279665CC|nr:ROK family transcriptional regulator [Paenibacillus sp. GD4]MDQ1913573.1 ROK family transcriptional regulator [Paenibacillus sp. GD4]